MLLAWLADETPEGRSIVALAKSRYGVTDARPRPPTRRSCPSPRRRAFPASIFRAARCARAPSTPSSRRRGPAADGRSGAAREFSNAGRSTAIHRATIARGTPLAVSENGRLLGVVHLKDIVKPDIKARFAALRAMGIKTVMVTGDNPLTAAAIASEAGVDDFIAQATPEDKLTYIRKEQQGGRLIAMCGDGTNDAPALAQADVGVAMQTGTQAAREAGNMVDLDSDPTKLIEIVAHRQAVADDARLADDLLDRQ